MTVKVGWAVYGVFWLDCQRPEACRVIAADPARAVETVAPAPARAYPSVPVHAAGVTMLPDSWDLEDADLEFDSRTHWGAPSLVLDTMADLDGNTADQHCAFGWPDTSYTNSVTGRDADGPAVHFLQFARDAELGWAWGRRGNALLHDSGEILRRGGLHRSLRDHAVLLKRGQRECKDESPRLQSIT